MLDETVVLPDKQVVFAAESFGEAGPPEGFVLEEVNPPAFTWVFERLGRTQQIGSWPANMTRRGAARQMLSAPLTLPKPDFRGRRSFRFYDARDRGRENPSPILSTATIANINLSTSLPRTATAGVYASDREARVNARIAWSKDPRVRIIVMTSWGSPGPESDLKAFVDRYAVEHQLTLSEEAKAYFAQPPSGWSVKIDATMEFTVTINGVPVDVPGAMGGPGSLFDFSFQLLTPSRGRALCAVKVIDLDNPENVVVSDVIGIEKN